MQCEVSYPRELLGEREDPFELGADVDGEVSAAGGVNLDRRSSRFLDLVVGRSDDEDVLVVEVVCRPGLVEAACDDGAVVDDGGLVVDLANLEAGRPRLRRDAELEVVVLEPGRQRPFLACLAAVEEPRILTPPRASASRVSSIPEEPLKVKIATRSDHPPVRHASHLCAPSRAASSARARVRDRARRRS
jgi:hypothetical protein